MHWDPELVRPEEGKPNKNRNQGRGTEAEIHQARVQRVPYKAEEGSNGWQGRNWIAIQSCKSRVLLSNIALESIEKWLLVGDWAETPRPTFARMGRLEKI